jgi:thermitase
MFKPTIFSITAVFLSLNSQVAHSAPVANEYIVKMKIAAGESGGAQKASQKGRSVVSALGKAVRFLGETPELAQMKINSMDSAQINYLKSHPDVEYVEPNYRLSASPTEVSDLGVPPSSEDTYTQSFAATQTDAAWAVAKPYNDATVKTIVAVIDSGLDYNHGVFQDSNAIWKNQIELNGAPGIDDDNNGYIDDVQGWNFYSNTNNPMDDNNHGTHVAGIVVGLGSDILSTPIRESRIQIMPLKFLSGTGGGSTSDAIAAITYAVNNGAKVINNSWGGPDYSRALHEAYAYAYAHNVVIVSAAGNDSNNVDAVPMYPAVLDTPSNITVSSSTSLDRLSSFSNYSSSGLSHVSAPGSSILSSTPGVCSYPGCFRYMSGTSMAAPFVAGLAALVIREAPQLSAYQVKGIILGTVDVKSELSGKVQTSGRVNVLTAVNSAISNAGTAAWTPAYEPVYKVESRSVASDAGSDSSGGGCGLVKVIKTTAGNSEFLLKDSLKDLIQNLAVFFLILLPILVAQKLKNKKPIKNYKRKYNRFNIAKEMQIKVNDETVDLVSDSVSAGGISFTKNMKIETGQKIKVCIDQQEVEGEIVWSKQDNSYGVKFTEVTDAIKKQIEMMTMGLVPTN